MAAALRGPDGLHRAAILSGGRYLAESTSHSLVVYHDLDTIAAESDAVVVGSPRTHISILSADGSSIQTRYTFEVRDVKQGTASSEITVSIPGGKISFDDGTTAEILVPDFPRLKNNATYVLYLKEYNGVFYPTGTAQGVFELRRDGTVQSFADPRVDNLHKKSKLSDKDFLKEVEEKRKK